MRLRSVLVSFGKVVRPRATALVLAFGAALGLSGGAQAAEIVWASAITDPAGPDAGFVSLLEGAGHTVTRVPIAGALTAEQIGTLNAADLVIVGRANNSGDYDNANGVIWNEQITTPLINMSAYTTRKNRMGWSTGDAVPDSGPTPLVATNASHPIFSGITFAGDGVTMADDYNVMIDRGTTTMGSPVVTGANVIATNPLVTGGIAIAEWPAGTVVIDDRTGVPPQILAGYRMFFAGGSREADGSAVTTAGQLDLTAAGQQLFLNAVGYALTVPEPSSITLVGLGCAFLLRRSVRRN
jgi:hypothetical protein